jgi:hypothetical protein
LLTSTVAYGCFTVAQLTRTAIAGDAEAAVDEEYEPLPPVVVFECDDVSWSCDELLHPPLL